MEQHNPHDLQGESAGIVGFDVLRTLIAARQSASLTVRTLATLNSIEPAGPTASRAAHSLITLFANGTAANPSSDQHARDEAVIRQDERHG